ncbi:MAG: cation:proton antiporter [Nitrospirota bacterium]
MEPEFLKSIVIIFGVSAMVVFLLHRLKIPSIIGFIAAGIIIGPHDVGIVEDVRSVEILAEIGVILLLFAIGIEFSLTRLLKMKKSVLGGGGIQVLLTIALFGFAAYLTTGHTGKSVFIGFLAALSSTAIVFKILSERGETDSPHGRVITGILIFQDLCVIPLMLLVPALAGENMQAADLAFTMGKAALIIAIVLASAKWIVPGILYQIVHTRSRELFITTIILICLGIPFLTSKFGMSLSLGAFLAGLIISESEYAHQAISDILPFRDSFLGMFFVSIGMLINVDFIFDNVLRITFAVVLIFGLKLLTGMISSLSLGTPLRTSLHAGLGLAQIGEFSFILALAGKASGLMTEDFYQLFLSSSVATMMMTPLILRSAPSASAWIASRQMLEKVARFRELSEKEGYPGRVRDHVIIVGFGLNGRNLARVLKKTEIPYAVLEMNSDTVREMKAKGEPIYYGDGTSKEILHKTGIDRARLIVIAISDPVSIRRIVAIAKQENPDVYVIVRTRYMAEVDDLRKLGADEVIPEEFETSIEIFSRVLSRYQLPRNVITDYIDSIRKDGYSILRTVQLPKKPLSDREAIMRHIETETYLIKKDSRVGGHSIKKLSLRAETGVTIIGVQRGEKIHQNPSPDFVIEAGDILLLIGKRKNINAAIEYLESERFEITKYH